MNPDTNNFESIREDDTGQFWLSGGTRVPAEWMRVAIGELVDVKGYRFRVKAVDGTALHLEAVGVSDAADVADKISVRRARNQSKQARRRAKRLREKK